jgi:hypothetical protein
MQRLLVIVVIAVLVILNLILAWQVQKLKSAFNLPSDEKSYLVQIGDIFMDARGMYTYPGVGAYFVPRDSTDRPIRAPLTLTIFFSTVTSCAMESETAMYRRLVPVLRERGQSIVAVTSSNDSAAIAEFLGEKGLDIPIIAVDENGTSGDGEVTSFVQMGISPYFMPFKILYDSTLTAIYMRGANTTTESQAEFERAVLWLSELIANGSSVLPSSGR